jgi:hypothetical protein
VRLLGCKSVDQAVYQDFPHLWCIHIFTRVLLALGKADGPCGI